MIVPPVSSTASIATSHTSGAASRSGSGSIPLKRTRQTPRRGAANASPPTSAPAALRERLARQVSGDVDGADRVVRRAKRPPIQAFVCAVEERSGTGARALESASIRACRGRHEQTIELEEFRPFDRREDGADPARDATRFHDDSDAKRWARLGRCAELVRRDHIVPRRCHYLLITEDRKRGELPELRVLVLSLDEMRPGRPRTRAARERPAFGADSIRRNTAFAFAVQLTTSAFTAILTLVLVRALGPHGYGVFALALAVAGLVSLPSDFGISASASRFVAERRGDAPAIAHVLADALKLKVLGSGLVSVALFVASEPIATAYGEPDLTWPLRAVGISLFAEGILLLFTRAFMAQGKNSWNLRIVFSESALELLATVGLVALGTGVTGAAFGRA